MAGGAAGGFVIRAFESMLKECSSAKKYPDLQKAIQSYIGLLGFNLYPLNSFGVVVFDFLLVSISLKFVNFF